MSTFQNADADALSIAGFANNDSGTVTTRLGGEKPCWSQFLIDGQLQIDEAIEGLNESRGFRVVGDFATGFTYELYNDVGLDASGNPWILVDSSPTNLPFTVPAGTTPSLPTYQQVAFSDHNSLTNRNAIGAHDFIYAREFKTVTDLRAQTDADGNVVDLSLIDGARIFWRGYYAELDTGENWGIVRTGDSTALIDDGGTIFVIVNDATDGVWVEAYNDGNADVNKFGSVGGNATNDSTSTLNALKFLCRKPQPGGKISFNRTTLPRIMNMQYNLVEILFTEQGMTYPPTSAGAILPNGEIARNVVFNFEGNSSQLQADSSFSGAIIRAGERDSSTGFGQAHKIIVTGFEVIGSGTIGHTDITIMEGKHIVSADSTKGTSNLTQTFLLCENVIPSSYVDALDIRLFDYGVVCNWGFGFRYKSGSVQYCNHGVAGLTGFTNIQIDQSVEIELCGINLDLFQTDKVIYNAIGEASSLGFALYSSRFVNIKNWGEQNTNDWISDTINSANPNRNMKFDTTVGPSDMEVYGSTVNLVIEDAAVAGPYYFQPGLGDLFESIRYSYNNEGSLASGIDLSQFQVVSTEYSLDDISIEGRVENQTFETFGMTLPSTKNRSASSASTTAEEACRVRVENAELFSRIEIRGIKVAANQAVQDMQTQDYLYVGTITRELNENTIISWNTDASNVFDHPTTGTNVPIEITTPTTSIVSGTQTDQQDVTINFATGTPVSGTSEVYFTVELFSDQNDVELV